LRSLETI